MDRGLFLADVRDDEVAGLQREPLLVGQARVEHELELEASRLILDLALDEVFLVEPLRVRWGTP